MAYLVFVARLRYHERSPYACKVDLSRRNSKAGQPNATSLGDIQSIM